MALAEHARVSPIGDTGRWQPVDVDTHDGDHQAANASTAPDLLDLLERHRPAWQADALCAEYPDLPWFPERGQDTAPCKAVCARCSCAQECESYAEAEGIGWGIWAGENRHRRGPAAA